MKYKCSINPNLLSQLILQSKQMHMTQKCSVHGRLAPTLHIYCLNIPELMHALAILIYPSLPGNTSVMIVSYDCMGGRWSSCSKPAVPGFILQMEGHFFCDFKFWDSHLYTSATAADIAVISVAIWKDYFFLFCGVGWDWVPWVSQPLMGLLYQPWMTDEYGAFGGMSIGRGNRRTWRKPAPLPLFSTKNPTWLTWY
jgi:hypothetical protein